MEKEKIVFWLNNNAGKSESEIKSFLLSRIQEEGLEESWQKHYFLTELKRICRGCPANISRIINDLEKENRGQLKKWDKKQRRWGGYITAGLIFAGSKSLGETFWGQFVVPIVAIGAGFFYYRLKEKIKIKNEVVRSVLTFVILSIISALLAGFLTGLLNRIT